MLEWHPTKSSYPIRVNFMVRVFPQWSALPLKLVFLPTFILVAIIAPLQAQELEDNQPTPNQDNTTFPSLDPSQGLLSIQGGQNLRQEAQQAIDNQDYPLAIEKLEQARQIFNQLSNFHFQLSQSFTGIENRIADAQKRQAADAGQFRDETTYQLAIVHRAQNQPSLAIPLLIQVIRSQNPSSPLGKKSYQQLYEIGFVETKY